MEKVQKQVITVAALILIFLSGGLLVANDLPAETRGMFDRGTAEARNGNWDAAIDYFEKALKASPAAPQVLFNLGMARAQAGHHLIAAAWLNAYLAVVPDASDMIEVMRRIRGLEAAHDENITKILRAALDATDEIIDPPLRRKVRLVLAYRQAAAGDIRTALTTVSALAPSSAEMSMLYRWFAYNAFASGSPKWAEISLKHVTEAPDVDAVWSGIIKSYLQMIDIPGARAAYERSSISDPVLGLELGIMINGFEKDIYRPWTPQEISTIGCEQWSRLARKWTDSGLTLDLGKTLSKWSRQNTETGEQLKYAEIPINVGRLATLLGDMHVEFRQVDNLMSWQVERNQRDETLRATTKLAYEMARSGNFATAAALYKEAIRLDPADASLHDNLGSALADLDRLDEAIESYSKAVELDPNSASRHCLIGFACERKNQFEQAVQQYRKAIELDPSHPRVRGYLADALRCLDLTDEAIEMFKEAIDTDPDNASLRVGFGLALDDKDKTDEAIEQYKKAIEIDPKNASAYIYLGLSFEVKGLVEEAMAQYRKAIEIDPNDPSGHNLLGAVLADKGQLDDAIASYKRALELNPGRDDVHNNLGIVLSDKGLIEEAIASYSKAIELAADDATYFHNRALAYFNSASFDKARQDWETAIKLDPNQKEELDYWIKRAQFLETAGAGKPGLLSQVKGLALFTGEFEPEDGLTETLDTSSGKKVYLRNMLRLSKAHITKVETGINQQLGRPCIYITFNEEGTKLFAHITRVLSVDKEMLAMTVDGKVIMAPVVREEIGGGRVMIEGSFSMKEAKRIVDAINNN